MEYESLTQVKVLPAAGSVMDGLVELDDDLLRYSDKNKDLVVMPSG